MTGDAPSVAPVGGWVSRGRATEWWVLAGAGVLAMSAAWTWLGLVSFEELTEQCKSLAAGSTEEGSGAVFGIPPVCLAHVLGLIILGVLGVRGRRIRWTGAVYAVIAVACTSAVGIAVAQLLFNGGLFAMGAGAATCG